MLLLGILLIVFGALTFIRMGVPGLGLILDVFSIVTGVVIIIALGRVKGIEEIGMLLLGIWLILGGVFQLLQTGFPGLNQLMLILAIAAGILILVALNWKKVGKNIGKLLLGIYLILSAIAFMPGLGVGGIVAPALAIVAGIFILIER
jgi:hypothetical protein